MNTPDIFGEAVQAYYHQQDPTPILVHHPDFEDDEIPVPYLFRTYANIPKLEQLALKHCKGTVLDVGCCAGSHSLYLQAKNHLVTAIDISPGAIEVAQKRGVKQAFVSDFYNLQNQQFDTLLLLMNGSGIIGKLNQLHRFFQQAKNLLKPGGQLLVDSSDLHYLLDKDDDGGIWVDPENYYGEMRYQISYKNKYSDWFDWLYIDFNQLQYAAQINGFDCQLLAEGEHYDYLAVLKPISV